MLRRASHRLYQWLIVLYLWQDRTSCWERSGRAGLLTHGIWEASRTEGRNQFTRNSARACPQWLTSWTMPYLLKFPPSSKSSLSWEQASSFSHWRIFQIKVKHYEIINTASKSLNKHFYLVCKNSHVISHKFMPHDKLYRLRLTDPTGPSSQK